MTVSHTIILCVHNCGQLPHFSNSYHSWGVHAPLARLHPDLDYVAEAEADAQHQVKLDQALVELVDRR